VRRVFRLLPLPLCIAFSLTAHAADDEPPENYSLCPVDDAVPFFPDAKAPTGTAATRADQPTEIKGDSVEGTSGKTLNLQNNVSLNRGDQFLGADSLQYDQETDHYTAEGNVRYQDGAMRMLADRASGDQQKDQHKVENVRYQLTSRRGNGGAKEILMDGTHGTLIGSSYSTCPPNDRRWELRAPRIDLDTEEGFATARNATVRVGKVPVLYIPWFKFPIDDRRHTGLLYPNIGRSDRNGFDYRQPIYFNLAPNYDLTLFPRLMTKRGFLLGTEFRYLTGTGKGTLNFDFLPSDKLTDREHDDELADFNDPMHRYPLENRRKSDRGRFSFVGSQNLSKEWQARANVNWISDPRYFEDFANTLSSLTPYSLPSNVGLYGNSRYWDAGVTADYYQLADYTLRESNLQYNRLPRLYFNWERPYRDWLVTGVKADLTRFAHTDDSVFPDNSASPLLDGLEVKPGGSRIDLKPYVSFPIGGASWFITPTLAYRYTAYQLDKDLATELAVQRAGFATNTTNPTLADVRRFYDDKPTRSLPIGSLDAGLYFDRQTSFGGEGFLQTLEPRLFYLNAPYRDQSDLPLFDTNALTFSWGQLFRDNRFAGADRQTDANQLTLAMTTRLIRESDGREKLTASLGQIIYFDDSRVALTPTTGRIEEGKSAWVADANYSINDRWTVGASYQWDPKTSSRDLASLRTRYLIGEDGIVNLSYRYRRNLAYRDDLAPNDETNNPDLIKQVDLSFLYPLTPSWSLVGRYYYSMRDHQLLEGIAGVQWDSCCLAARVVARRYVRNRTGDTNDAIQFEIELKGLGNAGPDTESRLRRAILGYYRDDLYLVPPSELSSSDDDSSDAAPTP